MESLYIASFDIGKKNFAFCVEKVNLDKIKSLPKVAIKNRYNQNGTVTDSFKPVLLDIYNSGSICLYKNIDLTEIAATYSKSDSKLKEKKKYVDPELYIAMTNVLNDYKEYWNLCSYFVIEQQMSFGTKHNTMALLLGQHCYSYFSIMYMSSVIDKSKHIFVYPSYNKTQLLGSEKITVQLRNGSTRFKAIDKPMRKKWAVKNALEILTLRNDSEHLKILQTSKKKDDLADVICQLQAFKVSHLLV